jgi:hypothetical protein
MSQSFHSTFPAPPGAFPCTGAMISSTNNAQSREAFVSTEFIFMACLCTTMVLFMLAVYGCYRKLRQVMRAVKPDDSESTTDSLAPVAIRVIAEPLPLYEQGIPLPPYNRHKTQL